MVTFYVPPARTWARRGVENYRWLYGMLARTWAWEVLCWGMLGSMPGTRARAAINALPVAAWQGDRALTVGTE